MNHAPRVGSAARAGRTLVTLATACGAVACGSGDAGRPALVAGATLVFDGPTIQNGPVLSTQGYDFFMQDVHHDDAGWIVLAGVRWDSLMVWHLAPPGCGSCTSTAGSAGGGVEFPLLAGPDVATLEPVGLPAGTNLGNVLGVHRTPWRTLAVSVYEPDSALGAGVLLTSITGVDLATGVITPRPDIADLHTNAHPTVRGLDLRGVTVDNSTTYLHGLGYTTELDTWDFLLGHQSGLPPALDLVSADGRMFEAYFRKGDVLGREQICRVTVDYGADHTPRLTCAPQLAFPAAFRTEEVETAFTSRGLVGLVTDERGAVFAGDIDASGAPTGVALGKGRLPPRRMRIRQPYGNLVRLDVGASPRFVDLRPDGSVDELTFPASGCADASACKGPGLVWLEPLGGDDYMAFWVVDRDQPAVYEHQEVVAARVHATRRKADTTGFLTEDGTTTVEPSPIPEFPNALPAGPLERACLAAVSCTPSVDVEGCIGEWSLVPPSAPAYRNFIEAATQGCEAVRAAWGKPVARTTPCGTITCVGDVLVTKCSGSMLDLIDCYQIGSTCRTIDAYHAECTDGTPRPTCNTCTPSGGAVHCRQAPNGDLAVAVESCPAAGQTCQVVGGEALCVFPEPCAISDGCADDMIDLCVAADPSLTRYRSRCGDLGRTCVTDAHGYDGCDSPGTEIACAAHTFSPQCVGPYAVSCRGDDVHYVDCRDLGFASCTTPTGANFLRCE